MPVGSGGSGSGSGDELARKRELPVVDPNRTEAEQHAELERLIGRSAPSPAVHAANVVVGAADELARLLLSFAGTLVVLIALAAIITPWLWIAVGIWIGLAVWTILSFRRGRGRRSPAIRR